ncbi:hypothetical protein [Priestia megaterium]|uniref:hypothetical protein n=1 Tax=Priestia megaterium TaxID=1404 RepID=UPI003CF524DE
MAYVQLTILTCDEDMTENTPAAGGLSQCILKVISTVHRVVGSIGAPNYPT